MQGVRQFRTNEQPGTNGRIKTVPQDFVVEEIPSYEPAGVGEHIFLWIEKRGVAAAALVDHVAAALKISQRDIGVAGQKDRHAVTRQYVSVPARSLDRVGRLDTEQIEVLRVSRHPHKLRTGHLRGNRFSVLLRDVAADAEDRARPIAAELTARGVPNYFGDQRFRPRWRHFEARFPAVAG